MGNFTFSNTTIDAFILGFNHNASREGNKRTHFLLGKLNGKDIALCDSQYSNSGSGADFRMNTSSTNSGGWNNSYMRKNLLNGTGNSLYNALPTDLKAVISATTKYTDNTGNNQNSASSVTATSDNLFLLAEFEVFGGRYGANSAEQNYQKQYDYFKAGNSKVANHHAAVNMAVWWWLRSPAYSYSDSFRSVLTDGHYHSNSAYCSGGGSRRLLRIGGLIAPTIRDVPGAS